MQNTAIRQLNKNRYYRIEGQLRGQDLPPSEIRYEFDAALEQVKAEMQTLLTTAPMMIRTYTSHLAAATGKLIRAVSVLTCAMDQNGLIREKAVKMAASIEIMHLATLVHDDVIDNADLRRGQETLQKRFGQKTAVICGDYLVCAAMKLAAAAWDQTELEKHMTLQVPDYLGRVCLGELNQHINNGNLDLSVRRYLKIISGKTAALFEAAFFTGSAMIDTDPLLIKKYAKLGHNIGMIFQLTDDCMDYEATTETALKPVQSDYEQNVITLPLIFTLKNLMGFRDQLAKQHPTKTEINTAVKTAGGLDYTRFFARRYYERSVKLIRALHAEPAKEIKLIEILDRAYRPAQ